MHRSTITDIPAPKPLAYSPREAARLLGLSEPAIRARIFRGQLPVQKWGRRLLIRHEDLMRVLGR
jgi:excisionase family DNA binding protein